MFKQIQFILLLVFIISQAKGQQIDTVGYGRAFLEGEWNLIKSPTNTQAVHWVPIIGITIAGTALFWADESIRDEVQAFRVDHEFNTIAEAITHMGDPLTLALIPATGFAIGSIGKHEQLKHTSEVAGLSVIHAGVITLGIKALTGRGRPSEVEHANEWYGPSLDHLSFPSFHAAGSWALATSIARSYPEKKWLGVMCYSLATGVSLSRVYLNKHWASDVFWGSALGFGIGTSMVKLHQNDRFTFQPFFGRQTGVAIRYQLD